MLSLSRRLASFFAAVAGAAMLLPAQARAEGSLVVIMDGSGSMWGTIDGTRLTKQAIAREQLRSSLGKLAPDTRVGLTVLGHRRGDCTDVEVVRPPEPLDVPRVMEPLEKFNPRGRGPITLAVREAAKALADEPKPRSLLVIHDDADNCQADLCSAAAELQAAGITAHVVGLATKPEDVPKVACLAQTTGGRHWIAQNAEQAASFIDESFAHTASRMGGVTAKLSKWSTTTNIVPPPPVPASGSPAVHLRAHIAPDTELLRQPLFWTVAAQDQPSVFLFSGYAVNPTVPVAPGTYVVTVRDGAVSAQQTAEVRENRPANVTMILNAGVVHARAVARRNAGPLNNALLTVSDASGVLLAASAIGETTVLLPPGRVVVRAELGPVRAEQTVTVAAGSLLAVDMPLTVGHLELSTPVGSGGSELATPMFSVLEDDPDAPDGRREVARSAAAPASFMLPPGTYYVLARQGAVEARDLIAIGPGDVVKRVLAPAVATLSLATRPPPSATGASHISYRVTRIDGTGHEPIITSQPSPSLLLAPGRYSVEARYGLLNVRTVREVDVQAGQTQQMTFEHASAGLTLRMTGAGPGDAAWVIQDHAGKTVWTGAQPDAQTMLQAGRYLVRAETRNRRVERSVDLKAGENRLLEVPVE